MVNLATLAQLVERLTCNEDVVSSNLTGGSILIDKNNFLRYTTHKQLLTQ